MPYEMLSDMLYIAINTRMNGSAEIWSLRPQSADDGSAGSIHNPGVVPRHGVSVGFHPS